MQNSAASDAALLKVISASRRTDMVASDPTRLAARLQEKAPPKTTHTVVLWTKNPYNILYDESLRSQLEAYGQLFLHLSITGLGGTALEPRVPRPEKVLSMLPALIEFIGGAARMKIRFDPVVHFQMPDGARVCNIDYFDELAPILADHGVKNVVTSWVHIYGKVSRRLQKLGIRVIDISDEERRQEQEWLQRRARAFGLTLHGCCVPGWPRSACIDGDLFNRLHPLGQTASTRRARGQRPLCGCTESLDIGWYHECVHGCVYCYGNPRIYNT